MDHADRQNPPASAEPECGLVVMMCGLPGSGKSTYARALERRGYTRLSIDEVVWRRIGHDAAELDPAEYERHKSTAEQELWEELIRLLDARTPTVIDYSFWNRTTRDRYKALIESRGCRWELVRLKADLETLQHRLAVRALRPGANSVTVSSDLLARYFAAFEEPIGEGERVIVQLPSGALRLERLRADHATALLAFERENREYFARSVPDRGDAYFADFTARHRALLAEQETGACHFHVLLDEHDELIGRINLVDVEEGSAELGYRIGEQAAGRGAATAAVREMCHLATTAYGLSELTARTTHDNPASMAVLARNGFAAVGHTDLDGRPGVRYRRSLVAAP